MRGGFSYKAAFFHGFPAHMQANAARFSYKAARQQAQHPDRHASGGTACRLRGGGAECETGGTDAGGAEAERERMAKKGERRFLERQCDSVALPRGYLCPPTHCEAGVRRAPRPRLCPRPAAGRQPSLNVLHRRELVAFTIRGRRASCSPWPAGLRGRFRPAQSALVPITALRLSAVRRQRQRQYESKSSPDSR